MNRFLPSFLLSILLHSLVVNSQTMPKELNIPKPPSQAKTNVALLAAHITDGLPNDKDKAYHIFHWIAHNIKWDVKIFNQVTEYKIRTAKKTLTDKVGYSNDYAKLFREMCLSVDIPVQEIVGYEKNELHTEGARYYEPNHVWNTVYIDNQWQLLDCFRAAGDIDMNLGKGHKVKESLNNTKPLYSTKFKFKFNYNPEEFMIDPEKFRLTRLSADPVWQLTDTAMPIQIFERTEKDIIAFNEKYSKPLQNSKMLEAISKLDHNELIIESADRTYAFNPNYNGMKVSKHLANTEKGIENLKMAFSRADAASILNNAKREVSDAKDLLGEKKRQIKEECAELQRVNTERGADLIKFYKNFTAMNTKYMASLRNKMNASKSKASAARNEVKKISRNANYVNKNNLNKVQELPSNASSKSVELKQLDSIAGREARIIAIEEDLIRFKLDIEAYEALQKEIFSSMKSYMKVSDSALVKEARTRSGRTENKSDSTLANTSNMQYYKGLVLDSLQNEYFDIYDSMLSLQAQQKKQYTQKLELIKANAQSFSALKKVGCKKINTSDRYTEYGEKYFKNSQEYSDANIAAVNYINSQQPILKFFTNKYKNENDFFKVVAKNEDGRKKYIKSMMKKKEELGIRHAEQQLALVDEAIKKLTKQHDKVKKDLE
jgi:hypothetical protein